MKTTLLSVPEYFTKSLERVPLKEFLPSTDFPYTIPGTSVYRLHDFFELNFMQYSSKHNIVIRHSLDKIPTVLGSDFNIDLKSPRGQKFELFMCNKFSL